MLLDRLRAFAPIELYSDVSPIAFPPWILDSVSIGQLADLFHPPFFLGSSTSSAAGLLEPVLDIVVAVSVMGKSACYGFLADTRRVWLMMLLFFCCYA